MFLVEMQDILNLTPPQNRVALFGGERSPALAPNLSKYACKKMMFTVDVASVLGAHFNNVMVNAPRVDCKSDSGGKVKCNHIPNSTQLGCRCVETGDGGWGGW